MIVRVIGGIFWALFVSALVGIGTGSMVGAIMSGSTAAFEAAIGGFALTLGLIVYQWGRRMFGL